MRSGIAGNLRGARPAALDSARDAARRAGISVGAWIDSVIQHVSEQQGQTCNSGSDSAGLESLTARLDELASRLDRLSAPPRAPATPPAQVPTPSDIEQAVAEIAERQRVLDQGPAAASASPSLDAAGLERQLRVIADRIEALRRPCRVEEALDALRTELADIYQRLVDVAPRRALVALGNEVRALAQKIDMSRSAGADASALEGLERGVKDIQDALSTLRPAESLGGVQDLIKKLALKIDGLASAGSDETALRHIELAISKLRDVASVAASGEALAALSAEVATISAKVERLLAADRGGTFEALCARMEALANRLEQHGVPPERPIDELEAQIARLIEKVDASDARLGHLDAIERTLESLTIQISEARVSAVEAAERAARAVVNEIASSGSNEETVALKRDLSELRAVQGASDNQTQAALEAVHRTLEKLVERIAALEGKLRDGAPVDSPAPARPGTDGASAVSIPKLPARATREPRPIDPTLPADTPLEPGSVSPRARLSAAERVGDSEAFSAEAQGDSAPSPQNRMNFVAAARRAAQAAQAESASLAGARASGSGGDEAPGRPGNTRRRLAIAAVFVLVVIGAAHLAMTILGGRDGSRVELAAPPSPTEGVGEAAPKPGIDAGDRETGVPTDPAPNERQGLAPVAPSVNTALLPPGVPPGEPGRDSRAEPRSQPRGNASEFTGSILQLAPAPEARPAPGSSDAVAVQGSSTADRLPPSIGSQTLRDAALGGNPAAEYEIGVRYAEGRGVPQNLAEAVRWLDRAAKQGLAPAQYRLGSHYEKGQGTKKDVVAARQLYTAAAEKGNAKAMHNLAVLYAEGIDAKPDYRMAAQWFRRAAEHGIADSQYNLGILYARGIGVEQNLAESYKWFALAAKQGDQDAGKKRDDVAQRIDAQSLVAARLAVQTWTAQPQPDAATSVRAPGTSNERPSASPAKGRPASGSRKTGTT